MIVVFVLDKTFERFEKGWKISMISSWSEEEQYEILFKLRTSFGG